jgi:putative transposase
MVEPGARREAAEWMRAAHAELSQRRAARLVDAGRSTLRYRRRANPERERRRSAIRELAFGHPRFGYRRIARQLNKRAEWKSTPLNHKCVRRLMKQEKLQVRPYRRRRHLKREAPVESPAERPDQRWAMDFVFDWCANRRQLKIFTLVDHFTRETLALESGHSLPARRVVEMLERLRMSGRCPQELRVDNGPEFVSKTLLRWCRRHHVNLAHIQPGKPTQNGHVESFNGKLRDECLNTHVFWNLVDAQLKLKRFWKHYNSERPHSSLNGATPWEFAERHGVKPTSVSPTVDTARRNRGQANPAGSLRSGLTPAASCRLNL